MWLADQIKQKQTSILHLFGENFEEKMTENISQLLLVCRFDFAVCYNVEKWQLLQMFCA